MTARSPEAIAQHINTLRSTIPPQVRLIAVSKQMPASAIRAAYEAGIRDFGESRIQEALGKQDELQDLQDITWHLIGHLQSNKAAKALERFDWIHSLDSLKLAQRLNTLAAERSFDRSLPKFCVQIKFRPDPNKYGWEPDPFLADLPTLATLSHLEIAGLMTIPPLGLTDSETQAVFEEANQFAQKIQQQDYPNLRMTELSMGMSGDYALAIAAGATMVRLGRILFGERT